MHRDLRQFLDLNALQELRDENRELKAKLEEHTADMEKLHKGYEFLNMQLKILQRDYSSLFKSARVEFLRKTQIIAQLNAEKEVMVNSIKGGKHVRRHVNQLVEQGAINYNRAPGRGNRKTSEDDPKRDSDDIKGEK